MSLLARYSNRGDVASALIDYRQGNEHHSTQTQMVKN